MLELGGNISNDEKEERQHLPIPEHTQENGNRLWRQLHGPRLDRRIRHSHSLFAIHLELKECNDRV